MITWTDYPIDNSSGDARQALIDSGRRQLREQGSLCLPDFISGKTLQRLLDEVARLKNSGHRMSGLYPATSDDLSAAGDLSLPAAHRFIAGDLLDSDSPARQIYEHAGLLGFIADLFELPQLYRVADTMGCINYLIYQPGDSNGWHFDSTDFVVSICLQLAEQGGGYETIPDFRSNSDENTAAVAQRMLNPEDSTGVKSVDLSVGSLFLFKGRNSMHRVTEVKGAQDRIMLILSFHRQPGHYLSQGSRLAMYGRAGD